MNIKNENFATALDWLVQNKGIDGQKGLAEATGISVNTISRIMTGKVQPSDATLRILAEKYGFNMEWLRGRPGQLMFVDMNHHECANTHESPSVDADFYHEALNLNAKVIETCVKIWSISNRRSSTKTPLFRKTMSRCSQCAPNS